MFLQDDGLRLRLLAGRCVFTFGGQKCEKPSKIFVFCLFFPPYKAHVFFLTVLRFLHFRTGILSKSATSLLILMKSVVLFDQQLC